MDTIITWMGDRLLGGTQKSDLRQMAITGLTSAICSTILYTEKLKHGEPINPNDDAPRDKCTLSCAINGIHAAFHYLKKNYISGCVMTVPTGW